MKKIGFLFATIIMVMLSALSASALDPTGQCGDNVYWNYNSTTRELVISGTGDMYDYSSTESPFYNCDIKSVVVDNGVISLGGRVFYGCENLETIKISRSIESIGEYALGACSKLVNIEVDDENNYFYSDDGVLFNKEKTTLIKYPSGTSRTIYSIPNEVLNIGNGAFGSSNNLTTVVIPNGVTNIGDDAFSSCKSLINITIPDSVIGIGNACFRYCDNLETATIGNGVKTIGWKVFGYCYNLTDVVIGNSVENIGLYAFVSCEKITKITIPGSVKSITGNMFDNCIKLENIEVENNNTLYSSIDGVLFNKEQTKIIRYPIGRKSEYYEIPESVISIESSAFEDCINVKHITIPNIINNISKWAFYGCSELLNVYYKGLEEQWKQINIDTNNECLTKANIYYHYNNHRYNSDITNPTCTTPGYTTYTCECGDSYIDDFVEEKHTFSDEWTIDEDPTCKEEGMKSHHCKYCPARKDFTPIGKLAHDFVTVRVEPTCLDEGYTINACKCGEEIIEPIAPTGHDYDGSKCKVCDYDRADDCSCNCHKGGIAGLFWKIINLFNKLFKSKQFCSCGAKHW